LRQRFLTYAALVLPIDPLREPMESKVSLGAKPKEIERNENGRIKNNLPPQLSLSMPVMFSTMSYGFHQLQRPRKPCASRQGTGYFL